MGIATSSPVYTTTKKGTAYLELVPHRNKVRVQRTPAGKTLNRFWTVWLRQLILNKTDRKHGFAVELRDTSILVSSDTSEEGRLETVRRLAQDIFPLSSPPINRNNRILGGRGAGWSVDLDHDLTEVLREFRLLGAARVDGGNCFISLFRDQKNPFLMKELCKMVECHVALNYAQH